MGLFTKRLKSSDNSTQDDGKAQSGCCAPITFEEDGPAPEAKSSGCCAPITFEEEDETPAARPS